MAGKNESLALGDIVTLQRGTTYKSALLGQPGPVLLGLASIKRNGGFRDDNLKTYGGESPSKLLLKPGDVFVSLKDVTQSADLLGAVARVPPEIPSGRVTQDTVKLTFTRKDISPNYVYWMLRTPGYREYCRAHAIGTTNLSIARDDFLAYPIARPSTQAMVLVNTLDALDDKIELNRKMNETLEQMAQALFKSWFVDFDPVHAKAAGRQPAGMDKATADLFPDSFVDSELGKIPKGWRVAPLSFGFEVLSGGTPSTSNASYWNGSIPWYSVKDAPQDADVWVINTEKTITTEGVENSAAQVLPPQTTIISARGTVGKLALTAIPMAMNQSCFGLRGRNGLADLTTYYIAKDAVGKLLQNTHGTVFDTINRQTFEGVKWQFPPSALSHAFESAVGSQLLMIKRNLGESKSLAKIRDALLPRLLSGGN